MNDGEHRPRSDEPDTTPAELGLTDLTDLAGVSVRTVRYYIAEGLLPPPVGAGPRASYTDAHLNRLRLIGRLKEAYLPLREIRRRLRDLDEGEVRALLSEAGATERSDAPHGGTPDASGTHGPDDSAALYLARLLPPDRARRPPSAIASPPAPAPPERSRRAPVGLPGRGAEQTDETDESAHAVTDAAETPTALTRADLDRGAALAALSAQARSGPDASAETWHRIALGDDAELHIRADAFERRRDQIDALVGWARRVLG